MRDPAILERFLQLAGGPDAPIVIIPTAGGAPAYSDTWAGLRQFRDAGITDLTLSHTYREKADSEEFVTAIQRARGVP